MKCFRLAGLAGLSLVVLMASVLTAKALMIAPPPPGMRVANADVVVVGKVTRIENKSVYATSNPKTPQEQEYTIAIVAVEKALKGAKGETHIRVGYVKPKPVVRPPQPVKPGVQIRPILIRPRGVPQANLTKGLEVCLFLKKHHKEAFYIMPNYYDVIQGTGNKQFKQQVADVETSLKILADPMANLKSKDEDKRIMAVALLMSQYNQYPRNAKKVERVPVGAEESKLILQAIADADWNKKNTTPFAYQRQPRTLFYQLGMNKADGWEQPRKGTIQQRDALAKKWLKANIDKFRVKKYVAVEATEK